MYTLPDLDTKDLVERYMIKIGVIGLGMMGQHHARVYKELGCELVGVVDSDLNRAREIGERCQAPYYTNHREIIDKVEAVTIAVPTSLHKDIALDFLRQGIHCLVEKPIASNAGEAEAMIGAAQYNNAKLMVGHIERFNPVVLKLKELVDKGTLGKIVIISTRRVGPSQPRVRDIGIIIDSATHDIDMARFLIGKEPIKIYSKAGRLKHATKEDFALIMLDFGDAAASIEVNWFTPRKERKLVVTGSEGIAYLDYIKQKLWIHEQNTEYGVEVVNIEPLKVELNHFIDCVTNNLEPAVNGREGLSALSIALEASKMICNV